MTSNAKDVVYLYFSKTGYGTEVIQFPQCALLKVSNLSETVNKKLLLDLHVNRLCRHRFPMEIELAHL